MTDRNNNQSSSDDEFDNGEFNNRAVDDINLDDLNVKITLKSSSKKTSSGDNVNSITNPFNIR